METVPYHRDAARVRWLGAREPRACGICGVVVVLDFLVEGKAARNRKCVCCPFLAVTTANS